MSLETSLTSIQEVVERSIFHSIRKQCVAKGYTPDIFNYPETQVGYDNYLKDLAKIPDKMGFAIEVFNSAAPADRVAKQLPRIVIATQGYLPGSVGGDQSQQYELNAGRYYSYIAPPTTSDLYINIHIVSNNIIQHRVLVAIISLSMPRMGYIKGWPDEDFNIFVNHLSYVPVRQYTSPDMLETIYRYVCPDLFEVNNIIVKDNIPPLKEVTLDVAQLKQVDLHIEGEVFTAGEFQEEQP
jgi:hypothetical protein